MGERRVINDSEGKEDSHNDEHDVKKRAKWTDFNKSLWVWETTGFGWWAWNWAYWV